MILALLALDSDLQAQSVGITSLVPSGIRLSNLPVEARLEGVLVDAFRVAGFRVYVAGSTEFETPDLQVRLAVSYAWPRVPIPLLTERTVTVAASRFDGESLGRLVYRFRGEREEQRQVARFADLIALLLRTDELAYLTVRAEPEGSVYIDDELYGRTPLLGIPVLAGQLDVRVEVNNRRRISRTIEVFPGENRSLRVEVPFQARMRVGGLFDGYLAGSSSDYGAQVAVDVPLTERLGLRAEYGIVQESFATTIRYQRRVGDPPSETAALPSQPQERTSVGIGLQFGALADTLGFRSEAVTRASRRPEGDWGADLIGRAGVQLFPGRRLQAAILMAAYIGTPRSFVEFTDVPILDSPVDVVGTSTPWGIGIALELAIGL